MLCLILPCASTFVLSREKVQRMVHRMVRGKDHGHWQRIEIEQCAFSPMLNTLSHWPTIAHHI